ncbi:MAG: tRNA (guanosine(37)-N1)-methyltransferase TrmD [Lachnospiraceae bacterium]|nr:tRNA (guanosine(37)-N1)-methyltransferase TrmD [Lachnospiraceae bacterium]
MNFHVLTLFPEMIGNAFMTSITGRAADKGLLTLNAVNIRDFAEERRKGRIDDYSYGGGAGMIMQAEPVYRAWEYVRGLIISGRGGGSTCTTSADEDGAGDCAGSYSLGKDTDEPEKIRVLYMSPAGRTFDQRMAEELSVEKDLVFLCGHYEGIDQRVLDEIVTDEVSIGDYVLTGGELPALVMMDAISRLVEGVLSNEDSAQTESFMGDGMLEYPQYSRPEEWHGKRVPPVLLSGDHAAVDRWRREQSLIRTASRRPDLCSGAVLDKKDRKFIAQEGLGEFFGQPGVE